MLHKPRKAITRFKRQWDAQAMPNSRLGLDYAYNGALLKRSLVSKLGDLRLDHRVYHLLVDVDYHIRRYT